MAIGLVALLPAGLVWALGAPASSSSAVPTVTVPHGRVGDVATYDVEGGHEGGADDQRRATTFADRVLVELSSMESAQDMHGAGRLALRLQITGSVSGDGPGHNSTQHLDLVTRDAFRIARDQEKDDGTMETVLSFGPNFEVPPDLTYHYYFDVAPNLEGTYRFASPNVTWVRHQGYTFRLGDDLAPHRAAQLASEAPARGGPRTAEAISRVDRFGTFQNEVAVAILERSIVTEPDAHRTLGDMRRGKVTTTWVSGSYPVPVLVEEIGWTENEAFREDWHTTYRLVGFERGTGPDVPWGKGALGAPAPAERSAGNGWRPDDGGSRYPINIERADEFVSRDPRLTDFQEWKAENPGWQLVGVLGGAGFTVAGEKPGHIMVLTYAAPMGSTAYRVQSTYFDVLAPPFNEYPRRILLRNDGTDYRLPSASPPVRPLTIAQVDRVWQAVGDPAVTAQAPERLIWGYGGLVECAPQAIRVICDDEPLDHALATMHFGVDRYPNDFTSVDGDYDLVVLDVAENRIIVAHQGHKPGILNTADVFGSPARVEPKEATPTIQAGIRQAALPVLGVGAAAALIAAMVYAYHLVKFGLTKALVLSGFSRISQDRVLDRPTRASILEVVQGEPGINATSISRSMSHVGWSTLVYHLTVMVRHGLLVAVVDGRHRRFFAANTAVQARGAVTTLRNDRTRDVYEAIQRRPNLSRRELALDLGLTAPGVGWHLQRLLTAGLVERAREGRSVLYRAAPLDENVVSALASSALEGPPVAGAA